MNYRIVIILFIAIALLGVGYFMTRKNYVKDIYNVCIYKKVSI